MKLVNNRQVVTEMREINMQGGFKALQDLLTEFSNLMGATEGGKEVAMTTITCGGTATITGTLTQTGAATFSGGVTEDSSSGITLSHTGSSAAIGTGGVTIDADGGFTWGTNTSEATSVFNLADCDPTNLFEVDASGDGGVTIAAYDVQSTAGTGYVKFLVGSTEYRIPLYSFGV